MAFKTIIIFEFIEVANENRTHRFRLDLSLPFPPYKDLVVSRKGCVCTDAGPFEKVKYNYTDRTFRCWMKPYEAKTLDDLHQGIENLLSEGWKRID